jgi:hypothetical protein
MPQPERRAGTLRTTAWNRHACTALAVEPQHISPGSVVTDEVELNRGIRRSDLNHARWFRSVRELCRELVGDLNSEPVRRRGDGFDAVVSIRS